ncbi:hypothetical protein F2P81_008407 [Scophthalmus maximus]|uniref:Uncharacterized protein n=1 Tax=Scophthalmus maximus TaxID=52904 RepID=A0A6A4TD84_SCOMX|nr:hypothetical protein F2P81_008407 [Scophthalmus maximus]
MQISGGAASVVAIADPLEQHASCSHHNKSERRNRPRLISDISITHYLTPLQQPPLPKQTWDSLHSCAVVLHVAHITVSQTPTPPASPHHLAQHLALWGWLQAPVEVCVAVRCNTSLRGPSTRRRRTECSGRPASERPAMFIMH